MNLPVKIPLKSCGPGNHQEANPVCRACGVDVREERKNAGVPVPVEYMMAFVRALIRGNPSGDLIALSMYQADHEVPISKEQREAFIKAVGHETDRSPWPKGFF